MGNISKSRTTLGSAATPAKAQTFSYPLHAMAMIEKFAERVAARPNFKPDQGALILKNPVCEHLCDRCFMEWAIAPERLAWWQGELARACGTSTIGRA